MKVLSTFKVLKSKILNEDIDELWIDWALEMFEAGYQSQNLFTLAGVTKPYNQFELQELSNKVLNDLNINYSDQEYVFRNYVQYLLTNSFDRPETYFEVLKELNLIYSRSSTDHLYPDFQRLFWAKEALLIDEEQWYWPEADRQNIDWFIGERFRIWLDENRSG